MIVKLLTEYHLRVLSFKRGCTGSSESTHVKIPHCWKSCRSSIHGRIQRGGGGGVGEGQGVGTTLKNHKNTEFLSNTGPDPLKNYKASTPTINVWPSSARQRNAI